MMADKTDLIVVRNTRPNDTVAHEMVKYLTAKPHEHTVDQIADAVGATVEQVTTILSNYEVGPRGGVKHVGEGKGGGWLPEEIAAKYRK